MSAGNNITVVGNCTREPELRFTPNGQAVATFGVAVNRRWQNKTSNEWEEAVSFFDVTAWTQLAENVAETVGKGTRVIIDGRLEQQSWDDKTSGEKRSKVIIVADDVGTSLRYATATVTKNPRSEGNNSGGSGGYDRSSTSPARQGSSQRSTPAATPVYADEEPF